MRASQDKEDGKKQRKNVDLPPPPKKKSPVVLFSPLGHSLVESGRPVCTDWTAKKDLLGRENR